MAKKVSMKQQIYQQIANKQVEQVLNQQREQQNAQLMADFDNFMKQQQNPEALMADFNSWKQQNAAPQPRQTIPSIADTQPKRDLQAEAREYFANVRKERREEANRERRFKANADDYLKQQQEENILASQATKRSNEEIAKEIAENKSVERFIPKTDIANQNNVNDYRKTLLANSDPEQAKKAAQLQADKEVTKETETQKQINAIPDSAIEDYAKKKGISVEAARAEVEDVISKANAMNTSIEPFDEAKVDQETTEKAQAIAAEQKRKANQKQQNVYEAALNNAGDAITGVVNGPIRLAGMAAGKDWDLVGDIRRERVEQANEQHPVASNVGRIAGMAAAAYYLGGGSKGTQAGASGATAGEAFNAGYGDALLNGATKSEAIKNALFNGGRQMAVNTIKSMPIDLATDIIPTLANDIASDKSIPEIIKSTTINTLINGGMDSIGDVVSMLKPFKAIGRTVNGTSLDELIRMTENLPGNEADDIAKQLPGMDNFTKNSLDNVNTSVYDDGVKNVDSILKGNDYGTDIGKGYDGATGEGILRTNSPEGPLGSAVPANGVSGGEYLPSDRVSVSDNVTRYPKVFDDTDAQKLAQSNIPYNDYHDIQEPELFSKALETAKANNPHGGAVDSHSTEDIQKILDNGGKTFLTADGTAGGAVDNGNLTAVFKDSLNNDTPRAASAIAMAGVKNGAIKGDCFGKFLVNSYSRSGFEPVARMKYVYGFNEVMDRQVKEQLEQGLIKTEPDVYFLKLKDGYDYNKAIEEYGKAKQWTQQELDSLPLYDDYDEALKYRDSLIDMNLQYFAEKQPKQGAFFDVKDGLKERGTSKHIRNDGTPMRMEGVSDEVVSDFKDNPDMYKVLKNSDTLSKAEKIYNESSDALVDFRDMVRNHDPAALPLGHQLAKDYSAAGNHEAAAQIYREMGEQLTKAGQFSQAAAINMMKNDPLTARAYFERELDALNKAGAEKYGKKWKDFVLTDEERAMFDKIAPGDSEAIKNAIDKIGVRIEKEYPASAWEKVLEFRRVAMLFNTRTIVRNTLANPPTAGLRYVSDRIEALGQYAAHLINPDFEVTQAIRGSNLETRKLAKEIYNSSKVKSLLEGGTGRLSEIPSVGDYAKSKQMFKGGFVSDWVNKMTNGGVEKLNAKLGKENAKSLLELTRSSAYKALEVTDNPMVRENFISRLGSYIRAKGIKNAADVPDEAILMAYEEAMKATYKDNSFMVQAIRNFKSGIERTGNHIIPGLGDMASQALIPYVQAPGNIAARTIDYSGIGFGKGIAKIVKGASANDVKMISKGIEEASKGATGSLMAALGYALYKSGVITGTYSNDNDQKAFEKKNGFREFAFRYKVNGQTKYDTIDWMQPFVDTIMPGVLLAQAIENSDKYDSDILRYFGFEGTKLGKVTGVAKEGVKKNVNYFFDSTPLKNLGELFKGNYGKETDLAGNLWENTVEDFASALVPAGVNAVAKTVDPVQRQTYDPSNAFGTFVNGVAAKLPKVSEALPVKYDTWGQPMTYGNSKGEAAFAKMLYPGEHTSDKADEIDKELNRLFETTGSNAVFPQVAPSKVNGEKINNKEVSQYQQDVGVRNKLLVDGFINSSYYDALEDTDKADKIAKLYGVSKAITERDKFGKEVSEDSEYKKAIEAYDEAGGGEKGAKAVVDYYNAKAIADSSGLSANSNAYKEIMNEVLTGDEEKANELIEENKTANDMYAKYNLTGDENAAAVYNKAGENGLKYYSEFKSKGLTDYRAALTYDSATKEITDKSKLPTMDDFIRGYKKIDSYGKSNGHVDQTEFLSFLNDGNYSDEQAAYYATLYGDWTTKPKISTRGKNKGKWIFGK